MSRRHVSSSGDGGCSDHKDGRAIQTLMPDAKGFETLAGGQDDESILGHIFFESGWISRFPPLYFLDTPDTLAQPGASHVGAKFFRAAHL